jgi:SAM-dependent methyltransferase
MNPYRMGFFRLFIMGLITLASSFWVIIEKLYLVAERRLSVKKARIFAAYVSKPILNYGCGDTDFGDVNVDIVPRSVSNFVLIKPSPAHLPFPSKHFGAVICSHVKEHVPDPEALEMELERVADRVYMVVPSPIFIWTWLWPEHRWVFINGKALKLR